MTDNTSESTLKQRKRSEEEIEEVNTEKETSKAASNDSTEVRSTWQTAKYYFNRFRYYHFVVADTIDLYVSAACLWIINLYFKLFMGVGPEPSSVLTTKR